MTPKEKAKELIDRFYNHTFNVEKDTEDNFSSAKQCALIAIEEILNEVDDNTYKIGRNKLSSKQFWLEVKQEIDKL